MLLCQSCGKAVKAWDSHKAPFSDRFDCVDSMSASNLPLYSVVLTRYSGYPQHLVKVRKDLWMQAGIANWSVRDVTVDRWKFEVVSMPVGDN